MSDETPNTPATEAAPATEAPAPVVTAQSAHLRHMLDRESQIRAQAQELATREAAVAQATQQAELLKTNPLAFMEANGVSYADMTARVLEGNQVDPTADLRRQVAALQADAAARMQASTDANRQAALDEARANTRAWVDNSPHKAITAAGMQNVVYERMHKHQAQTGQLLSEDAAAQAIEADLIEMVQNIINVPELLAKLNVPQVKTAPVTPPAPALGNTTSLTASTRPPEGLLSYDESLAKMASILKFNS